MSVRAALEEALRARRLSQTEFGPRVGYTPSMLSDIVCGRRVMAPDVARKAARLLDYPRLYVELALDATGGVGPRWFDGEGVDRHHMSRLHETMAEAQGLLEALGEARSISLAPSEAMREEGRAIADRLTDIIDEATNLLGQICLECGVSYTAVWLDRDGELQRKGYIDREEVRRRARAA